MSACAVSTKVLSKMTALLLSLSSTLALMMTLVPAPVSDKTRVTLSFLTAGVGFSLSKYLLIPFVTRISVGDLAMEYPAKLVTGTALGIQERIAKESLLLPLTKSTRNSIVRLSCRV